MADFKIEATDLATTTGPCAAQHLARTDPVAHGTQQAVILRVKGQPTVAMIYTTSKP